MIWNTSSAIGMAILAPGLCGLILQVHLSNLAKIEGTKCKNV